MKKGSLKITLYIFLFVLVFPFTLRAVEFREGRIKLVIQENTGRFSLYYLTDIKKETYEALFVDQDPRTSFLGILVDDKAYRMGESSAFRLRINTDSSARPAIVFDSAFLSVSEEFSFIRAGSGTLVDGLRIDIRVTNKGERQIPVGIRFLLDTKLGEGDGTPFSTDKRTIGSETLVEPKNGDQWWFSKNDSVGLMGNIQVTGIAPPDSIIFANWKRLNDAPWKSSVSPGRNFNYLPYSVGDSALCYYFDTKPLERGAERVVSILLAAASDQGFSSFGMAPENDVSRLLKESSATPSSTDLALRTDLITIRDLLQRIDALLAPGASISEDELTAMETVIRKLKDRNGIR